MLARLWRPEAEGPNILSTSFGQPLGARFVAGRLEGYPLDMRVKATEPAWPPAWYRPNGRDVWVGTTQWGLGCYERWLGDEGDVWLQAARGAGEEIVRSQRRGGLLDGALLHEFAYPHTFDLDPPWASAIAQGQAASLLLRLAAAGGGERLADAALRALAPLEVPSSRGGVAATLDGSPFAEEYPTDPPSFVLNGALFALWGCADAALATGDPRATRLYEQGVETLSRHASRWDLGWWSRYDLYPHRTVNVASRAYHELHIAQLRATAAITGRGGFADLADRFAGYLASPAANARAFAHKAAFRVLTPRRKLHTGF